MTDKADLYQEAMKFAKEKASISYVQRKCRCSYNDAERMLERMVSEGVISTYGGRKAVGAGGVQALSAAQAVRIGTIAHIGNGSTTLIGAIASVLAAPQQEAQEPALFVSPKQLAALTDPDDPEGEHGRYLPARKTSKGLFTQPLYTAPQPAPAPLSDDAERDAARRWDAPKYNHRQREWCIAYEVETGFDPMMDDYEAGLQTFAEAAEASLRWYEDHTSDAHLRISRKIIPGGRCDAALAAQGGK